MNNKKQSSIEYLGWELNTKLFYNISPELWEEVNKIFEQAKEMHKKEIQQAYVYGAAYQIDINNKLSPIIYYQELFEQ